MYCKVLLSSGCICVRTTEIAEYDCCYYISTKYSFGTDDLDVLTFRVTARGGPLDRAV